MNTTDSIRRGIARAMHPALAHDPQGQRDIVVDTLNNLSMSDPTLTPADRLAILNLRRSLIGNSIIRSDKLLEASRAYA